MVYKLVILTCTHSQKYWWELRGVGPKTVIAAVLADLNLVVGTGSPHTHTCTHAHTHTHTHTHTHSHSD